MTPASRTTVPPFVLALVSAGLFAAACRTHSTPLEPAAPSAAANAAAAESDRVDRADRAERAERLERAERAARSERDVQAARAQATAPDAALVARLKSEVEWLADDAREGRRAGTEAGRVSARWLADQLNDAGLEPAGVNGTWLQPFEVALEPRDGGNSSVTLGDKRTSATPLFCSEQGEVVAPLVWCGYGIDDDERKWNDFGSRDLAGSIALVVRGTPPNPDAGKTVEVTNPHAGGDTQLVSTGDGWGSAGSIFTKVMNAKRRGAVAVLLVPKSADEGVLAFDAGHGARAGIPAVTVGWDDAHALARAALGLESWPLEAPAPSAPASKAELTLVADVVRESGVALNVLGRLRGSDRSRTVVVGAHYDHLGFGGTGSLAPDAKHEIHNGADDNASGTAAVIEIARMLKNAGTPPCDLVFALWSGEELGLLGSEHWATHPTLPWGNVRANLNLDMVGRAGNGKLQVLGAGTSSAFAAWMEDAGKQSGLELTVSVSGQALGGSSDHQTFLKRKLPALHLFSGLHADYHKPTDDAERFEAEGAARVVALGTDLALRMASTPNLDFVVPPAPKEGEKVASGGFKVRLGSIPNYAYDGKGVLIDGASQGTPAERAGLIRGDVLIKLGDVALENVYDLTYALGRFKPGDVVPLYYVRDGKQQQTRVTLVAPAGEVR